jgi:hypothetical protein
MPVFIVLKTFFVLAARSAHVRLCDDVEMIELRLIFQEQNTVNVRRTVFTLFIIRFMHG